MEPLGPLGPACKGWSGSHQHKRAVRGLVTSCATAGLACGGTPWQTCHKSAAGHTQRRWHTHKLHTLIPQGHTLRPKPLCSRSRSSILRIATPPTAASAASAVGVGTSATGNHSSTGSMQPATGASKSPQHISKSPQHSRSRTNQPHDSFKPRRSTTLRNPSPDPPLRRSTCSETHSGPR
jgi:hypothetical protein